MLTDFVGCEIYLHHSFDGSTCAGPDAENQTVVELGWGECSSFEGEGFEIMVRCSVPEEEEGEVVLKRVDGQERGGRNGQRGGTGWCCMVGAWCCGD